jgi:hypothetical protein
MGIRVWKSEGSGYVAGVCAEIEDVVEMAIDVLKM